jgi:hypothetical protein
MKSDSVKFFLQADPNGNLEFSLDADQESLEFIFSQIYKTPEGKTFRQSNPFGCTNGLLRQ